MAALVRSIPWDVRQRLKTLCNVKLEVFDQAVQTGRVALLQCTDNDPPFIPGTAAWWRTLRSLREQLIGPGDGWRKDDSANYSLTVSDMHRMCIVVASGDEMTGLAHAEPTTKAGRGPRTKKVVSLNAQGDLFPETLMRRSIDEGGRAYDTWILLIYIKSEEVRAELSRPTAMDGDFISQWSERIILPIKKADPDLVRIAPDDFGPVFDPAVKRIA